MDEPKLMLVILDGLGDRRIKRLGWKTPLESAKTKNMDWMAGRGSLGYYYPLNPGLPVGSGIAHSLLFGLPPSDYPGRGVFEALGMGFELEKGDLAFRINFATLDADNIAIDRRAGRAEDFLKELTDELNKAFKKNPFDKEIVAKSSYGYRGSIVIKGWNKSVKLPDIDPQLDGRPVELPEGGDDAKLAKWIFTKSREVLRESSYNKKRKELGVPVANGLLLRGAGIYGAHHKGMMGMKSLGIAKQHLYLGAARYAGMYTLEERDEARKIPLALENLDSYDFFFVHFKKPDNAGHDGLIYEKKSAIEEIDKFLKPLRKQENLTVAITGDHATPCELKTHSGDPVPLLYWGKNVPRDDQKKFGERYCLQGGVGQLNASDVLRMLSNLAGRMLEVGK